MGAILSASCKTEGPIWPSIRRDNSVVNVPEKSPSWRLAIGGAEALTDGSSNDSNGHSDADDSRHTTDTSSALTRYKYNKRGDAVCTFDTGRASSGICPQRTRVNGGRILLGAKSP